MVVKVNSKCLKNGVIQKSIASPSGHDAAKRLAANRLHFASKRPVSEFRIQDCLGLTYDESFRFILSGKRGGVCSSIYVQYTPLDSSYQQLEYTGVTGSQVLKDFVF